MRNAHKGLTVDSTYLQTMLEVIETGSFSKAAERLCVTQSAVSRRLKALEEQYGLLIFDRSGPVPVLTDAGRLISEKARRLLTLERELDGELRNRKWQRPLSFCCTPAFGISHLPEVMRRFMHADKSGEGIDIHFEVPDRIMAGIHTRRYDLAVLDYCDCMDIEGLTVVPLADDEILFMSSPALGIPTPTASLDDLGEFVLFSRKEGCCSRRSLDSNLAAIGRSPAHFQNVVVIDDLNLIAQAVAAGRGITFVPKEVFASQIISGNFVIHRIPEFNHHWSRTLIIRTDLDDNTAAPMFVECVESVVRDVSSQLP